MFTLNVSLIFLHSLAFFFFSLTFSSKYTLSLLLLLTCANCMDFFQMLHQSRKNKFLSLRICLLLCLNRFGRWYRRHRLRGENVERRRRKQLGHARRSEIVVVVRVKILAYLIVLELISLKI